MKINRKVLTYAATFLVAYLIYVTTQAAQWVLAGCITALYLAFAFGVDKFIIDIKNKKVEIDDSDKK